MTRVNRRIALCAAALLALTGCASTGADGNAGEMVRYGEHTLSSGDIEAVFNMWVDETEGTDVANRLQIATLEILRDDLLAKAEEVGAPVIRADAQTYAQLWLDFKGIQGTPSEEMVDAVEPVLALAALAYQPNGFELLRDLALNAEGKIVANPRIGRFDTGVFLENVNQAVTSADRQMLQGFSFTAFQNVVGFAEADTPWTSRSVN